MGGSNRDFKGVWIPKEIWLSQDLSLSEKALLVEILSLDNAHGCFASNKHFANFLGISERQVSRLVQSLEKKKYITSTTKVVVKGEGQAFERIIRGIGKFKRVSDKNLIEFVTVNGSVVARRKDA